MFSASGEKISNLDLVGVLSLPVFIKVVNFNQKTRLKVHLLSDILTCINLILEDTQDWVVVYHLAQAHVHVQVQVCSKAVNIGNGR